MTKDWKGLSNRVAFAAGLETRPLGFKFFKEEGDLKNISALKRSGFKRTVCQYVGSARYLGKAWAATAQDQLCQVGAWCLGVFPHAPESFLSGELYATDKVVKVADAETAKKMVEEFPKNKDRFEAFAVMPLDGGTAAGSITFEPDLVIIYGEPGQLGPMIFATCGALGIPAFEGRGLGEVALCSDGLAACWNTGEPKFFMPCIGDRAFGGTSKSEAAIVIPADKFNEAVVGNIEKMRFPRNWGLEAPLGASADVSGLMRLAQASDVPLDQGTPLLPEKNCK